jgi:hypothetical protein
MKIFLDIVRRDVRTWYSELCKPSRSNQCPKKPSLFIRTAFRTCDLGNNPSGNLANQCESEFRGCLKTRLSLISLNSTSYTSNGNSKSNRKTTKKTTLLQAALSFTPNFFNSSRSIMIFRIAGWPLRMQQGQSHEYQ